MDKNMALTQCIKRPEYMYAKVVSRFLHIGLSIGLCLFRTIDNCDVVFISDSLIPLGYCSRII